MAELQFFQRYAQRENVVTNNVLLLLRLLHQLRRGKLETLLADLLEDSSSPDAGALQIGPRFLQQVRGPQRVADGLIRQHRFDLLIETKLGDSFDLAQAVGHLEQLRGSENPVLLLLGRNPDEQDARLAPLLQAAAAATPRIRIAVRSFADLIDQCRAVTGAHDDELAAIIDDFDNFCVESDLIPVDEFTLFVPPCGHSYDDNLAFRLYYCPASRSRRVGRWLGIYRRKAVHAVGRINRILDVQLAANELQTPGASDEERRRILGATDAALARGWDLLGEPHTFYLCADMVATLFEKDSPGGCAGHRYFDLRRLGLGKDAPMTSITLAQALAARRWSEWGQG